MPALVVVLGEQFCLVDFQPFERCVALCDVLDSGDLHAVVCVRKKSVPNLDYEPAFLKALFLQVFDETPRFVRV